MAADRPRPRHRAGNGRADEPALRRYRRLALLDIDHTLLDSNGALPEVNRRAVRRAVAAGAAVVLATARSHHGAAPVHAALGLDTPLVVASGTCTCAADGAILEHRALGGAALRAVLEHYLPAAGFIALRTGDAVHLDDSAGDAAGTPYQHEPQRRWRRSDPAGLPDGAAVLRAALYGADAERLYRTVRWQRLALRASFYPATRTHPVPALAVSSASATKGAAARRLRRRLGLEGVPTLSVGDSLEDRSLFDLGASAAPADAHPEARAAAGWIAPGCDHGAVAAALERFGFLVDPGTDPGRHRSAPEAPEDSA